MKVYWHQCGGRQGNFGDKLTPLLLDFFGVTCEWAPPEKAELFGVGSILHIVPPGFKGIVWSSGTLYADASHDLSAAHVMALRGKHSLSQSTVRNADAVALGDGGLLVSLWLRSCRKKYKLGLVPHYIQAADPVFAEIASQPDVTRIDICDDPRAVVQRIAECDFILSSSLHGLIAADSLGVLNRWVDVSPSNAGILGRGFKFRDYYSAFGIDEAEPFVLGSDMSLDGLLALFDGHKRPSVDEHKLVLIDCLREVLESRSRYAWHKARLDINERDRLAAERLARLVPPSTAASEVSPQQTLASDEVRAALSKNPAELGRAILACLTQLVHLHGAGITHGDIRADNIRLADGKAHLAQLGWTVPSDKAGSPEHRRATAADLRALGHVFKPLSGSAPDYAALTSLLIHSYSDGPHLDASAARVLAELLCPNELCGAADGGSRQQFSAPKADAASVVRQLLQIIAARNEQLVSFEAELADLHQQLWTTEARLAAAELVRILPPGAPFILIDGDQWRGYLQKGATAFPFVEREGIYGGPPADDDEALAELARLGAAGALHVVFAKPAFWWLDFYRGFCDRLATSAKCIHADDLLIVYRLT